MTDLRQTIIKLLHLFAVDDYRLTVFVDDIGNSLVGYHSIVGQRIPIAVCRQVNIKLAELLRIAEIQMCFIERIARFPTFLLTILVVVVDLTIPGIRWCQLAVFPIEHQPKVFQTEIDTPIIGRLILIAAYVSIAIMGRIGIGCTLRNEDIFAIRSIERCPCQYISSHEARASQQVSLVRSIASIAIFANNTINIQSTSCDDINHRSQGNIAIK